MTQGTVLVVWGVGDLMGPSLVQSQGHKEFVVLRRQVRDTLQQTLGGGWTEFHTSFLSRQ